MPCLHGHVYSLQGVPAATDAHTNRLGRLSCLWPQTQPCLPSLAGTTMPSCN